jgi:hypothetical protein
MRYRIAACSRILSVCSPTLAASCPIRGMSISGECFVMFSAAKSSEVSFPMMKLCWAIWCEESASRTRKRISGWNAGRWGRQPRCFNRSRTRRVWRVDKAYLFPTLGGEPLWHVSRPPRNFRLVTNLAETFENRRLPGTTKTVRSSMVLVLKESKAIGECIALGYSREPPVATFFGRMQRSDKYREVVWCAPKRLPSGRWEQTSLVDVPIASRTRTTSTRTKEIMRSIYPTSLSYA